MKKKNKKKEQKPPAFQFYPREFLTSEKVLMMEPAAVGGYIFLLCHAWVSTPPCSLPLDNRALATLSRLGNEWDKHSASILDCFITKDGRWYSERLMRANKEYAEYIGNQSKAGKTGMEKRWGNRYNAVIEDVITKHKSASATASAKKDNPLPLLEIPEDLKPSEAEIRDWLEYKKQRGQSYKAKGLEALWRCLRAIPEENRRESIDQSMANNWAGIFECRKQTQFGYSKQPLPQPVIG